MTAEPLIDRCKRLEAFETPAWAIEGVLDVEVTTRWVIDPCSGLGAIGEALGDRGLHFIQIDIEDWSQHFQEQSRVGDMRFFQQDFMEWDMDLDQWTVIMNPPFSLAEAFVLKAQSLNARKIICFQRQAWRESATRRPFWENNSPARVWVCGARASCWRFDLIGTDAAAKSGSPTSYAWYVWERGHKGAEVTSAIYPTKGDA